jgi:hypothetical protein
LSDITQGADAPDENALFQQAVEADAPTLEKFENPPLPPDEPEPKPADKPAPPPAPPVEPQPDAPVPAGRLREESEARRRAERERDELLMRISQQQRPPPSQPQRKDMFEDPSAFVQQEVAPYLEQIVAQQQRDREAYSADWAVRSFGEDKVTAGRQALEQGMQRGDQAAWATYQRAMQSHDPYGVITRWHMERETLNSIGGDLESYKQRLRDEFLNDPEFRKQVFEAAKGQAAGTGMSVARPAQVTQPKAPTVPSLSNIGAGGGDEQMQEPSDMQLFRTAVSAKRR